MSRMFEDPGLLPAVWETFQRNEPALPGLIQERQAVLERTFYHPRRHRLAWRNVQRYIEREREALRDLPNVAVTEAGKALLKRMSGWLIKHEEGPVLVPEPVLIVLLDQERWHHLWAGSVEEYQRQWRVD